MRTLPPDRHPQRPGRLGRIRLLLLHSRFFWGLRLHLLCTPGGLPVAFALTGAKADERTTLLGMLEADRDLVVRHPGQTILADMQYYGRNFETALAAQGLNLLRKARKGEPPRAGTALIKPLRQTIESINQTLKAQLDLERHGGRTVPGVAIRVIVRVLALTAVIWHNDHTSQPGETISDRLRPLTPPPTAWNPII